jgi:hypothetical protein
MDKKKIYILAGLGGVVLTTLLIILLVKRRKKKKMVIVKGEYIVPKGTPNMADALHSFERRKSDGFGGRMSTKIKEALVEMYKQGINPDVTDLKVNVDSKNYKVTWEAKIEPSKDGKAYTGFMTYGSAGGGADTRAKGQEEGMKKRIGGENYKLVLDFKNPTGIYIRQFFYTYTKPKDFPNH